MIAYKVVTRSLHKVRMGTHPNEYWYSSSNIRVYPYNLTYKIGKRTSALRGTIGVFVFDNLGDAEHFAAAVGRRSILKVKIDRRGVKTPRLVSGWLRTEFFPVRNNLMWQMYAPPGTITVPSVIPIKEIL